MPDLLVFDLDGTLIDSRRDIAVAINAMLGSFGLPPLEERTVISYVGNGATLLVERVLGGRRVELAEAIRRYLDYYAGHSAVHTRLYPGVAEGLSLLHRSGAKLAVVTNKPRDLSLAILEKLGVLEFLDGVTGGDSGTSLKPEPDALLAFKTRFNAASCWMMGDHYTDLEAGRRAGFFRVFASYGFGEPRGENPDLTVDSFAAAVEAALE